MSWHSQHPAPHTHSHGVDVIQGDFYYHQYSVTQCVHISQSWLQLILIQTEEAADTRNTRTRDERWWVWRWNVCGMEEQENWSETDQYQLPFCGQQNQLSINSDLNSVCKTTWDTRHWLCSYICLLTLVNTLISDLLKCSAIREYCVHGWYRAHSDLRQCQHQLLSHSSLVTVLLHSLRPSQLCDQLTRLQ